MLLHILQHSIHTNNVPSTTVYRIAHRSQQHPFMQELEDRKSEVDARGSNISDSTPVVRIKGAIKGIKTEVQQMSVRIGVLQHQLTQVQLAKSRSRLTSD